MISPKVRGTFKEERILPKQECERMATELLQNPQWWTKFGEKAKYHSAYFGPVYGRKESGRNHPLLEDLGLKYDYVMSWPKFLWPLRDAAMQLMEKEHANIREIDMELLQCNVNAYTGNTSIIEGDTDYWHSNGCVSWHTDEPFGTFEPKFFGRKTITICVFGHGRFSVRKLLEKELKPEMRIPEVYKTYESVYERYDANNPKMQVERNVLGPGDAIVLVGAALHGCKHAAVMDGDLRITANFRMVSTEYFDFTSAKRLNEQPVIPVGIRVPPPEPIQALHE